MNEKVTELYARERAQGKFRDRAALAQHLKATVRHGDNERKKLGRLRLSSTQVEALESIMGKISNILHGDPSDRKHWDDIMGYATLVVVEIEELQEQIDKEATDLSREIENQDNSK